MPAANKMFYANRWVMRRYEVWFFELVSGALDKDVLRNPSRHRHKRGGHFLVIADPD